MVGVYNIETNKEDELLQVATNNRLNQIKNICQNCLFVGSRSIRDRFLLLFTIILSAFILPLEHPSHAQQEEGGAPDKVITQKELEVRVSDPDLKLEVVSKGLEFPTNIAFLGKDDILVLENEKGTLRRIINSTLLPEPLLSVDLTRPVERCICGIAIAENNNPTYIFLYFTEWQKGEDPGDRLYRYEWINNTLANPKLLLDIPATPKHAERHAGGGIVIGSDNNIYLATGDDDGLHHTLAQNEKSKSDTSLDGTSGIIRMTQDGHPIGQDGILGDTYPLNLYYGYGIRNSFGLDFDPVTGKLWDTENGPDYGDEINLVEPGFNSGWNKIQGFLSNNNTVNVDDLVNFGGRGEYSEPEFEWQDSLGPTALKFLDSDTLGRNYHNDMFVGDVNNGRVYHFNLNEERTELDLSGSLSDKISEDTEDQLKNVIFAEIEGGVTDLEVGPDGYLYIVAFGQGAVYRVVPNSHND
jgi:glucose/arabinose dehydrogenase